MANNPMTMDEAYECPKCNGQDIVVKGMEQIFDDARSESVQCLKCGSTWTVYYKMTDISRRNVVISDIPMASAEPDITGTEEPSGSDV